MVNLRKSEGQIWIRWIFILLLSVFIQSSLMRTLGGVALIVPNFLAILIVYLALNHLSMRGVVFAFLSGLMFDMASGVLLGPWAAAATVLFLVLSFVTPHIFPESLPAVFILSAVGSAITTVVFISLSALFPTGTDLMNSLLNTILIESLVTALFAPLVALIIFKIMGRSGDRL